MLRLHFQGLEAHAGAPGSVFRGSPGWVVAQRTRRREDGPRKGLSCGRGVFAMLSLRLARPTHGRASEEGRDADGRLVAGTATQKFRGRPALWVEGFECAAQGSLAEMIRGDSAKGAPALRRRYPAVWEAYRCGLWAVARF